LTPSEASAAFAAERPRLVGLAYRLLGSLADAEDVVQDAWMRWQRADHSVIERPGAWLTTAVSRLGLDVLRRRQRERIEYVGPWLPEPLVARPDADPAHVAAVSDSLTTAFLVVLESLDPTERLVLLLVDVFDEPFASVATITGKTDAACRQIAVRARRKVRSAGERPPPTAPAEEQRIAATFALAALAGDRDALMALLSPAVRLVSDGGPNRHAARRPVVTPERVARLVANVVKRVPANATVEPVRINGSPGLLVRVDGVPVLTQAFEIADGLIVALHLVTNPDKLGFVASDVVLI
jgi:RNA polymerase sigma-70 factor, ECF subfamily